jgi:hypothetical protein
LAVEVEADFTEADFTEADFMVVDSMEEDSMEEDFAAVAGASGFMGRTVTPSMTITTMVTT